MNIAIVIPTKNEEKSISVVLKEVMKFGLDVLVLDSSTDETPFLAEELGAKVIYVRLPGKGNAIRILSSLPYDAYVVMDGDLTYPPKAIPKIVKALEHCDLVLAVRAKIEDGAMSLVNKIGNLLLTALINFLYGGKISDALTGMYGLRKELLFGLTAEGFEIEADIVSSALLRKAKICEVPITYSKRAGKSKLSIFDGVKIFFFLLKKRIF